METIVITLQNTNGETADLEVPTDVPLAVLLPEIMNGLGWSNSTKQDGKPPVYQLVDANEEVWIGPQDTLRKAGVVTGEILTLRPVVDLMPDAGPVVIAQTGEVFRVGQEVLIGRSSPKVGIDLSTLDIGRRVSREHAHIIRRGDLYAVCDRESRNGTYLNGVQLTPHKYYALKDGDVLQFGRTGPTLQFFERYSRSRRLPR